MTQQQQTPEQKSEFEDNLPEDALQTDAQDEMAQELERLREDNAKLRDQWARAAAETDNVRKRSQREQEEMSRYAVTNFARDMVNVLENLKRATESMKPELRAQNPAVDSLAEGVELTLQELVNIFSRYGIARIDPIGQKFDHNLHQAVVQVEDGSVAPGTVVQVVQAGYTIHDRLLRPAMVAVSKAAADDANHAPNAVDTSA